MWKYHIYLNGRYWDIGDQFRGSLWLVEVSAVWFEVTWFALIVVSSAVWCVSNLVIEWRGWESKGWSGLHSPGRRPFRLSPPSCSDCILLIFFRLISWLLRLGRWGICASFLCSGICTENNLCFDLYRPNPFGNIASASSVNCSSEAYWCCTPQFLDINLV